MNSSYSIAFLISSLSLLSACGGGGGNGADGGSDAPESSVLRIAFEGLNNDGDPQCLGPLCDLPLKSASLGMTRIELIRCDDAQCARPGVVRTLYAGEPVRNDGGDLTETTFADPLSSVLAPIEGDVTVSGLRLTIGYLEGQFKSTESFVGPQQSFRVCLGNAGDPAQICGVDNAILNDIVVDLGDASATGSTSIGDGIFGFPGVADAQTFEELVARPDLTAWNVTGHSLGSHVRYQGDGSPQLIALFPGDVELRGGSGYSATLHMDWSSTFHWTDDAINPGGGSGLWGFYYDGPFNVRLPTVTLSLLQTH